VSEVKERSGAQQVRKVVVAPQPTLAHFCQQATSWLILVVIALTPLVWGGMKPWAIQIVHGVVWLAGLLWVARLSVVRRIELVTNPLSALVLILVSYIIVRYGLAEVESVARPEMMLAVTVGFLFFLTLNNNSHRLHVTLVVVMMTVVAVGLVLYEGWQCLGGFGFWQHPKFLAGQFSGTFLRPGDLAGFLGLIFPLIASFFFFSRWSHKAKIALLIAATLVMAGLALTHSLGGWLGALASIVVLGQLLLRRRNIRMRWVIIGGTLWLVLVVGALMVLPGQPTAAAEPPLIPLWRSAFALARQHWSLGIGPGMFPWHYISHRTVQSTPTIIRNEYLQVFTDYGLVGLALLLWLAVIYVIACVRILSARAERYSINTLSNRYAFVVGALGTCAAIAVQSAIDSPLQVPANLCLLAVIMATSLTCGVHPSGKLDDDLEQLGRRQTIPMKGIMKWALIFGLLFVLGLQATRLRKSVPAEWLLARAQSYQANLNWADAETDYLRAWKFDIRSYRIALLLGDFYSARATWTTGDHASLTEEALRWYDRAYTRNPYVAEALVKMGRLYDLLGKRDQAFERFQRALDIDPQNAAFHTQLALHYLRWQNATDAIKQFRHALQLNPADTAAEQELQILDDDEL
jgi:Tetratricopeptide repeat